MSLVTRVKAILLEPQAEWPHIASEAATVQSLYTGYIMILAAIGPIAMVLGNAAFAVGFGARIAVVAYLAALIVVAILALIADAIAPSFGGRRDYVAALKLTAYSLTPVLLSEIALVFPPLGMLVLLVGTVFGFYLFQIGAPTLHKCTTDRSVPYTIVILLCAIVLYYVVRAMLFGMAFGVLAPEPGAVMPLRY